MTAADTAIAFARAQIGKPYRFGATGPDAYDCSGLVYSAYKSAGVSLGRTTYEQIFNGSEVTRDDLAPGDLLFPDSGHVQLYVGSNRVIEAPHTGAYVRETNVWGFWRARRVASPGTSDPSGTPVTVEPVSVAGDLLKQLPFVGKAETIAEHLADPKFMERILIGFAGVGVIVAAILVMNRDTVVPMATKAIKDVGEVAAL